MPGGINPNINRISVNLLHNYDIPAIEFHNFNSLFHIYQI
jgi:hypothetical protein